MVWLLGPFLFLDIDIAELPDADKKYGNGALQHALGFRIRPSSLAPEGCRSILPK